MSVSAPFEKLIGKRVGHYRLEQLLEAHQWGPVFLANNRGGNRYLVRFIGASLAEGQGNTFNSAEQQVPPSRLQQEVHRLASLSHPQLVPLKERIVLSLPSEG
jgi:hypothetical protein